MMAQFASAAGLWSTRDPHLSFAVAARPELLVLDEPVASLDPLARREVSPRIDGGRRRPWCMRGSVLPRGDHGSSRSPGQWDTCTVTVALWQSRWSLRSWPSKTTTGTISTGQAAPSWICSQLLSQSHFRLSDASLGGLLHDQRQSIALDDGSLREGVLAERRRSRRLGTPGGWPTPKVREVLGLTHLRVRRTRLLQSHNRDTQRWAQHVMVADESASSPERPVRSPHCSRPSVRGHLGPSRAGRCCPTPGHTTRPGQQAQKCRPGGRQFRSVYEAV